MDILYIGHYNEGSTTRMRGKYLQELLPGSVFTVVNIDIPFAQTSRISRSVGWRFKRGPLIRNINTYIEKSVKGRYSYDVVWIDKGVFIEPELLKKFKANSTNMVHFTPDPAFTYHRSRLFYRALEYYDYCITTKSFELDMYRHAGVKAIFCTQGYDPALHKPYHSFEEKTGVVFIGHREDDREEMVAKLLEKNIQLTLAGPYWERFAQKNKKKQHLSYKGAGLYGADYAKEISAALLGLGFISKIIPELHTTRTFEIPACATALVTEINQETTRFFEQGEAIFFKDVNDLAGQICEVMSDKERLRELTRKGHDRVRSEGYDYKSILSNVLVQMCLLEKPENRN